MIGEFVDVESGTRKGNNREKLSEAIEMAQETGSTLLIAKLDRLSRNVAFITSLMDSGIDFIACDIPEANKFTIHIFAALAEQEADLISQRTKAALQELKKKGKKLGTPENLTPAAIAKSMEVRKQNAFYNENNRKAGALICSMHREGRSFYWMAKELNKLGFKTRRGKKFTPVQVKLLYERYSVNATEEHGKVA